MTPVIGGLTLLIPLITVFFHQLLIGMNHQVTSHYSFKSEFGHRPRSTQPHRAILRVQVQTSLQLDVTAHSVTQLSGWTRGSGQVQCVFLEQTMLVRQ